MGRSRLSEGGCVVWFQSHQLISCCIEASCVVVTYSSSRDEGVWLWNLLKLLGHEQLEATPIQSDNKGTISIIEDPSFYACSKHIDIQHHYVRECIKIGEFHFYHVPTYETIANLLTRALPRPAHEQLSLLLGLHPNS